MDELELMLAMDKDLVPVFLIAIGSELDVPLNMIPKSSDVGVASMMGIPITFSVTGNVIEGVMGSFELTTTSAV